MEGGKGRGGRRGNGDRALKYISMINIIPCFATSSFHTHDAAPGHLSILYVLISLMLHCLSVWLAFWLSVSSLDYLSVSYLFVCRSACLFVCLYVWNLYV